MYQRVARKSQVEVCERRGKSFIKYFKEPIIKMLRRNTPYGNIIYMLRLLENDRKTSFLTDLFSRSRYKWYNFLMEDTRKGYLLSKIVYLRVRDWTSGRSLSEQSLQIFWHQSEARTAATVWNWSGETLSPGALLAVLYFSFVLYFSARLDFP